MTESEQPVDYDRTEATELATRAVVALSGSGAKVISRVETDDRIEIIYET